MNFAEFARTKGAKDKKKRKRDPLKYTKLGALTGSVALPIANTLSALYFAKKGDYRHLKNELIRDNLIASGIGGVTGTGIGLLTDVIRDTKHTEKTKGYDPYKGTAYGMTLGAIPLSAFYGAQLGYKGGALGLGAGVLGGMMYGSAIGGLGGLGVDGLRELNRRKNPNNYRPYLIADKKYPGRALIRQDY